MGRSYTLSGPDGSGKTSIASILYWYLGRKGAVCINWLRGTHFAASILARFFSSLKVMVGNCNPYYNICIPSKMTRLWLIIEFISILPYIILRKTFCRMFKYRVYDRGVLDFYVWLVTTLGSNVGRTIIGRFLIRLVAIENPVYVTATPITLRSRSDLPWEFVRDQVGVYEVIASRLELCRVTTDTTTPEEATILVLHCVSQRDH